MIRCRRIAWFQGLFGKKGLGWILAGAIKSTGGHKPQQMPEFVPHLKGADRGMRLYLGGRLTLSL